MTLPELKEFFETHTLPDTIKLSEAETIIDVPKFVKSHLFIAGDLSNISAFSSFHARLIKVKDIILEMEAVRPELEVEEC
ncbi:DUF6965 family protein [Arcticibacter tournemirensis]|uniref:DUF6965 domain-containing protein n=1 Tax=Arcticibacter tournemirensis TaxID=699437 RepID=A0A4Q0MAI4_9SPHI|nr:hypothetical protein [Arcticibacter tournemirensis]KAA8485306.1 hypothetical protein F1649_04085 [Arcticibacter tournemirensis]RXF70003.1 hypothetical protein EKH83_08930 [Arcticibacter tournemirensis]